MTKKDRSKLFLQGKTIMRSKLDKDSKWRIYQYSSSGGWIKASPCSCCWDTKEDCEAVIDGIVLKNENIFKDE